MSSAVAGSNQRGSGRLAIAVVALLLVSGGVAFGTTVAFNQQAGTGTATRERLSSRTQRRLSRRRPRHP